MITFDNVTKIYEDTGTVAFQNLNEQILEGEFILLTGESGVGKSTFIKLLLKEEEPTQGEIQVEGKTLSKIPHFRIPYYRRGIGVVFQDFRLMEERTVYENIEFARMVTGGNKKDAFRRTLALLKMLGLENLHKRYPSELSGGEKQRVCLARALVNQPKILLADEPTGNLDPSNSVEIMHLLDKIHKQGTTVIVATHDLASAQGLDYREISLDHKIN